MQIKKNKKENKMKDKKAIEFGFSWIFAILAGSFILFLAIYAATKFIGTQERVLYTESAARIVALLDPFETGLASGKSSEINFKKETRIYAESCSYIDNKPFGKQSISFSEKTFNEKYGEKGEVVPIKNKYVFMENIVEGKKMYVFSKPFFMPFKISDLIIISSGEYCFYDAPDEFIEEIEGLNIKNMHFPNETEKCSGTKVCFKDYSNCEIRVYESDKYVQKASKKLYYYKDLLYGAIFSSPALYECNVKRLMNKLNELGLVYNDKIKIIERKGCMPRIKNKLLDLMNNAKALGYSSDLIKLGEYSEEIDSINEMADPGCKLFN